ncbi:MAG TPA: c-type cytochrome [Bryobacteraceae bacterium]|jgi:mono/diheme cytochrome c family protein
MPIARVIAACLGLLCAAACEPWGKPGPEPAPALKVTDFKTLFSENCSGCHGVDGKKGPGRILNDPLYLAVIPKDALQHVIEQGRPGTAMPPWVLSQGGPLTSEQITALVNGIEQNWAKAVSLPRATPSYTSGGLAGDDARGKKLFLRDCFACHFKGGIAGPVTDPNYLALVSDQNLRTSIIVGRPDLGMPDYRILNAGHALNDQDVADLVTYLASLRPANGAKQ